MDRFGRAHRGRISMTCRFEVIVDEGAGRVKDDDVHLSGVDDILHCMEDARRRGRLRVR